MQITFIDPITDERANGLKQYDPSNDPLDFSKIPNEAGVYIWGLQVKVGDESYFAPYYVGETGGRQDKGGLQGRIKKHYDGTRTEGRSKKELFDFSETEYTKERIQAIYRGMGVYDAIMNLAEGCQKIDLAGHIPDLIYWQDDRFLYDKCNKARPTRGNNRNQKDAVNLLGTWRESSAKDIAMKISKTKGNFEKHFYFIYAKKVDDMTTKQMEHATKNALKSIWVLTTAKADGKYPAVKIDLPIGTPFVHDLWSPAGTRSILVPART